MHLAFNSIMSLALFTMSSSFITGPIRSYMRNVNGVENVKVYEPFYKPDINNCLIFYTGASGVIPDSIYSNVLNYVSSLNITTYVYNGDENFDKVFDYVKDTYDSLSLVGHSSGCMKAIAAAKQNENINSLILFDPVNDKFIYDDKIQLVFDYFFNKDRSTDTIRLEHLKKCLFVRCEKSYIWSYKPFSPPFIPAFDLKSGDLDTENMKELILTDYGHSDILDNNWSILMHKTIDKGVDDRSIDNINNYHDFISKVVSCTVTDNLDSIKTLMKEDPIGKSIMYRLINH